MAAMARIILLYFVAFTPFVVCVRFGLPSRTLHFPTENANHGLGEGYWRYRVSKDHESSEFISNTVKRVVRDAPSPGVSQSPSDMVTKYELPDDHHNEMIVHWAGEGSKVIVALTRDETTQPVSTSQVYFSMDYGVSFSKKQITGKIDPTSVIDKIYHSAADNSRYIFTDIGSKDLWITINMGQTFQHIRNLPFTPKLLSTHKTDRNIVLASESDLPGKPLWKSEDFGESWVKIQDNVKSFWWGVEPDPATRLYIERQEPGQTSTVLYSDDYFSSQRTESILLQGIEDFEVRDEYLFATRKRMIEGQADYTLELLVSHERGDFQQAEFPNELLNLDFYIADASEHQVFVCVNHDRSLNTGITHLYISESAGVRFSLSLENVVYFNPQGPGKDTWLSYYSDQPFADIHKVEGLRGIYIASQFNDTQGGTFQDKNMVSLITFDKGGEWSRLNEPQRDSQGKPYPDCGILNSCSLHLTQKFSLLYPRSRTVPILSKKSAPGLIMASGTVGTSIKDNPAVFISTTAGVEWFEVLKDNYYYAFGDHGGLIVAVKQYGPTDEIRYSWNEGETWNTLTFSEEQIQVYDVMTEPGEHTTVFTLFGSSVGKQHTWMIVQVNLSSIFEYSCTDDDYKLWSPCEELADACLLGSKTVYERRIAHAKCYNGKDYDRPVSTVLCPCTREDYECDFGYKEIFEWNPTCVPDPESDIDPHAIPVPCHEGNFYTRSRGYRKVSGDLCTGGVEMRLDPERVSCPVSENPEFILYAMRTEVRRYILGDQRQETLPLQGLQNVIAVDFDYKDNFIYWADMATDKIMRYGLNGYGEHEVIVTGQLDTIEALSFDWLSGNIYWVDSGSKKIEVCRKNGINRRELFNASHSLDNPRALSLDPRRGWMYWTDWGDKPHIRRAHMDGLYHEIIISENIHWPNGIVVDDHTQKLFWTDAYFDRIETAYFDGSSRQVLLSHDIPHPYAIGVYKDEIYWDDWYKRAISKASKYDGSGVTIVEDNLDSVMDLKILAKSTQQGSNPCATNNGGCSQLCLVKPIGDDGGVGRTCKCGHDTEVVVYHGTDEECRCKGGETIINGTCVPQNGTCAPDQFMCAGSTRCIPASWHCDKDNDCGDSSDEQDCPYQTCHPDEFTCGNGRCISGSWQCDLDNDCYDWSDEQGCDYPTCGVDKFTCDNQRCIPITWRCDYDNDCRDNSDEMNCNYNNYTDSTEPGTCNKNQMTCDNGLCIPSNWRCDGYDDCGDNSDEPDSCQQRECNSSFEFKCKNNNCIYLSWKCDGMDDCGDNSDEQNCQDVVTTSAPSTSYPSSCNTWQFSCLNGNCVSYWWKCDGVNDCGDYSDEYDCGPVTNETSTTTKSYTQYYTCSPYEFECGPLATTRCIPSYWVCDGDNDCGDYSDENACPSPVYVPTTTTPPPRCTRDKFRCYDGHCLPRIYICNGYWDCVSGEDERNCHLTTSTPTRAPCDIGEWRCLDGDRCIDINHRCDIIVDCLDLSDETGCPSRNFTIEYVDAYALSYDTVLVSWGAPRTTPTFDFQYIVYWREAGVATDDSFMNVSSTRTSQRVTHLKAGLIYEFTVAIKPVGKAPFPKVRVIRVQTPDGLPSVPEDFSVHSGLDEVSMQVNWGPPLVSNGTLIGYEIRYQRTDVKKPPESPLTIYDANKTETYIYQLVERASYSVWMAARTSAGLGLFTEKQTITLGAMLAPPTNLHAPMSSITERSVHLYWTAPAQSSNVKGYRIYYNTCYLTSCDTNQTTTTQTDVTVNSLSPGTEYIFRVAAYNDDTVSPKTIGIVVNTNGNPLPVPSDLNVTGTDFNSVSLSWKINQTGQWLYGIYYGKNSEDLMTSKLTTKNLTYVVNKLESGVEYLFRVGVVGPNGIGLKSPVIFGRTKFDDRLRPRHVLATGINFTVINVSWWSPRDLPEKLGYIIYYREKRGNSSLFQNVTVPPTSKTKLSFNLTNLIPGAEYLIKMSTHEKGALLTEIISGKTFSVGPPLEFKAVNIAVQDKLAVYLSWVKPERMFNPNLGYAIFETDSSNNWTFVDTTTKLSYVVLGVSPNTTYYFKVCMAEYKGYYGEFSEVFILNSDSHEPHFSKHTEGKKTKLAAIIIPTLVVIALLSAALVVFIVRHQRLQRSFTQFANSHYDSRSGTTTFSGVDGDNALGEEEDSPMIRGFSDDEPLVVA